MNAKIIFPILVIFIVASYAITTSYLSSTTDQKTTTVESFRVQAQEARDREIQAQKDRQERENNLSRAIWLECFDTATSQTGSNFASQQKESYECWKQGTTNINSWTVAPAISGDPHRKLILKSNDSTTNLQQTVGNIPNANSTQWVKKINSKPVEKVSKANPVTLGTSNSGGKWGERQKGTSKKVCPTKTILRKWWNDPRVQYAYNISWWDMDFIKTIEAESKWDVNASWDSHKSFWLCQINKIYNPEMQKQYRALPSDNEKVLFCYKQYSKWVRQWVIKTRLYGYNVRNLKQNKNSFTLK